MERGRMERGVVEMVDTESLVPQGDLLRKVDRAVDFGKLYEIVEPLYSEDAGRPSVDPVVLFKIVHRCGERCAERRQTSRTAVFGVYAEQRTAALLHSEL